MEKLINNNFIVTNKAIDDKLTIFIEKLNEYVVFGHPTLKMPTELKEKYAKLSEKEKRAIYYSLLDELTQSIGSEAICTHKDLQNNICGCNVSVCCKLDPDVFEIEKSILDSLEKSNTSDSDYCSFFDKENKICTIYSERPFSCRTFFNFTNNQAYCIDADKTMNSLKIPIFMYARLFLGTLMGPYHSL